MEEDIAIATGGRGIRNVDTVARTARSGWTICSELGSLRPVSLLSVSVSVSVIKLGMVRFKFDPGREDKAELRFLHTDCSGHHAKNKSRLHCERIWGTSQYRVITQMNWTGRTRRMWDMYI